MNITVQNPEALSHKHPNVEGICTREGVITQWPAELPELTQSYIDQIEQEYAPVITVSAWQIRKALNQLNLRQDVETAVTNSGNQDLQDGWGYAKEFDSNNPLVVLMGQAINKTDAEMYAVFTLAATL